MLQMLLRSSALVLLMGAVFSPLEAGRGFAEEDGIIRSVPSKKKGEENEEKEVSLSNALNLGLDIDENTALPKGWNLVDSAKNRDINKPISLKKKPKGVELLGDNYAFYTNVPMLKDFDKTTFLFSVELRSTNPGVYIQYYDGKNAVSSIPYASKKGEWERLNIEFTVDANAKFHRLYSAILGAVKGNDKPSVDINNITLQRKEPPIALFEPEEKKKAVVGSDEKALEVPPRVVGAEKKAPDLPPRTNEKAFLDISQPLRSVPTEVRQEEPFLLSKALNSGFDMDEKTTLPKGWNLVDSAKKRDNNKPVSLKKKPKGIELLGDNYTFYTDVPSLKNFDKTTFVFSADVRSTTPGVHLQYYDGKNVVNSIPYTSKKGEWQTLNIEFTVDANARFHRLYSAILGTVKGSANPSVDINNIKLQRKEPPIALFEPEEKTKTVVESEQETPKPPRVVGAEKKAPELPPRVVGAEKKAPERPKAHPLANLLSGAKPLKVTSKVEEKKEPSVKSAFEQALDKRRSVISDDSEQDLLDNGDLYISVKEQESVERSLDEQIQDNKNEILAVEKKIQDNKPLAESDIIGGFTPAAVRHDKARATARSNIRALESQKSLLVKKGEQLVIQKQEEEVQKKRDEEENLRRKEANLNIQKKLALLKKKAQRERVSDKDRQENIKKAHAFLKKGGGHLPVIDQSQETDSRASLLSQISRGKALKETNVVREDTSLEMSRREIQEQRKAREKEEAEKKATEEFFNKKREEMIRREEEQEKERRERGEPEVKDEEWED